MKRFKRMAGQANILSIAMAMALAWVGRPVTAGPAGYIDNYAGGHVIQEGDVATSAALGQINGMTTSASGILYFSAQNRVWKMKPDGTLAWVAGTGMEGYSGDEGPATSAQLYLESLAVDANGNLYIAGGERIRKVDRLTGIISTVAGTGTDYSSGDGGLAISASLIARSIAIDSIGNLYLSGDYRIRKIDHATGIITTIAGTGIYGYTEDGKSAISARIDNGAFTVDRRGDIFLSDGKARIRKVDHETGIITTIAGMATCGYMGNGDPDVSIMNGISSLTTDNDSDLFVGCGGKILKADHASGVITTVAGVDDGGYSGDGDPAASAQISAHILSMDVESNLYISGLDRIRKINHATGIITTVAGNGTEYFSGDGGLATSAQFESPMGLAADSEDNLYIADFFNYRVRKIDVVTGIITTVAGGGKMLPDDGGVAIATQIGAPSDVTFDAQGNLYFPNPIEVLKMDRTTGTLSIVAGRIDPKGLPPGFSGDGGPAVNAGLNEPQGIALNADGDLYIADSLNNRIRKVDHTTGIIMTVAGTGPTGWKNAGSSGDGGPATSAQIASPDVVICDSMDNIYITDMGVRVRKIENATGIITTFAGNGMFDGPLGDGGPATSATLSPNGLAFDADENLYVSDGYRIRKVDKMTGIITTVAGTGDIGDSGDGGPATLAQIEAGRIAFDKDGNLYITDERNKRIRIVYQVGQDKKTPSVSVAYGIDASGSSASALRLYAQDWGSGFGALTIDYATNLQSPLYQEKLGDAIFANGASLGSSNAVIASLSKLDGASPASLAFSVSDQAGNRSAPSFVALLPYSTTGTLSHAFSSIPKDQGIVSILATGGGLRNVVATANGSPTTVGDVAAGEIRTLDLRSTLSDGSGDAISISAEGDAGTEACVLISSATLARIDSSGAANVVLRRGDMNADGRIDVTDATRLLRIIVGMEAPTAEERALGDANLDGQLNISDAVALLHAIVGG